MSKKDSAAPERPLELLLQEVVAEERLALENRDDLLLLHYLSQESAPRPADGNSPGDSFCALAPPKGSDEDLWH